MAYTTTDDDKITIANVEGATYATQELSTDPYQKMWEDAHYVNYFLCGYKAILSHHNDIKNQVKGKPKGMNIMIDSRVPPASGLSSSSAFTVCAAITTMHANGLADKIDLQRLADISIHAERMAGTACGGMDQTISIMGEMG